MRRAVVVAVIWPFLVIYWSRIRSKLLAANSLSRYLDLLGDASTITGLQTFASGAQPQLEIIIEHGWKWELQKGKLW
jgi:hypothetical protein